MEALKIFPKFLSSFLEFLPFWSLDYLKERTVVTVITLTITLLITI